jgi:glutathione S-transferase
MRLIGMLDSPYVRRVAVSLKFMGLPFSHESVSVFRHYDHFASINPVVKAPTLVTDDGVVLMDSNLILDYAERLAAPERRLAPVALNDYARGQRIVGLALAACEKAVQIVYEHNLRPAEKRHQPWLDRVSGQLRTAWGLIESEIGSENGWLCGQRILAPDIAVATAWSFCRSQSVVAEAMTGGYPAVGKFVARAEALPEFLSTAPD